MGDQLWDSLYWTRDLTRPDRLAKVINTIVQKNSSNTNNFIYNSQAAKNSKKMDLTQHDMDRVEELDKFLATHAHSSASSSSHASSSSGNVGFSFFRRFKGGGGRGSSSQSESQQSQNTQSVTDSTHVSKTDKNHLNSTKIETNDDTQHTLSRSDVAQYLNELSNHVHLEGEIIVPKPIDVHLVKLSKLQAETKLLSHTVLIRTRSNVHILPLRCPPRDTRKPSGNRTSTNRSLEDKVEQLTATVEKLTQRVSESGIGTTTYFYSGQLPTPNIWEADLIFKGNYTQFCDKLGKRLISAETVLHHFRGQKLDRGGYFYASWYYIGPRYCIDDLLIYYNVDGEGRTTSADNIYSVWKYSGSCGCCIDVQGWTFERRAFITCS